MAPLGIATLFRRFRPRLPFASPYWRWIRLAILLCLDALMVAGCYTAAFYLRLDSAWYRLFGQVFWRTLPVWVLVNLATFFFGGMYRQVWRYANFNSALLISRNVMLGSLLAYGVSQFFLRDLGPAPRSVPIIYMLLAIIVVSIQRFSWRSYASLQAGGDKRIKRERALIYGAGAAGDLLARHIQANPNFPFRPVGFVDDDLNKRGRLLHGLKIFGTSEELEEIIRNTKTETVLLAMTSAPGKVIRSAVEKCQRAGVKPLIMPDMASSLGEEVFKPRPVDIRDLLKRAPKSVNVAQIGRFFLGKRVLITGAGGSIGSEICRQVLRYNPAAVVLLDSSEFNLYTVVQELHHGRRVDCCSIIPVLGSATERRVVEGIFKQHQPTVVLHAAAYKHVPLLEENATEGMLNNILATRMLCETALQHKVTHFLQISSDKAVRPTNVMGATKRICELVVQSTQMQQSQSSIFCSVRFGNVLGSSGSVLPLFLSQIERGGPVTVTHPEVTRYFMLTSEAVGLTLQSIAMAKGGEIFVLDMGEPVKIFDMAQQLIRLSGKEPGRDIDIVFSGLRRGEKLYEELILEGAEKHSLHDEVYIAVPHPFNAELTLAAIDRIVELAQAGREAEAVEALLAVVSEREGIAYATKAQALANTLH